MLNLSQVRTIATALPEVTEEPHFQRTSFRIRGKIFATAQPGDHFLNVMVGESAREPALATYSQYVEKLLWGKKVVGLRVDLRRAEPEVVSDLLKQAWEGKAPKSLLAALK
jgi:hypothetical protein